MVWISRGGAKSQTKYRKTTSLRRGRKPKLSEQDKKEVAELYISGCSIKDLSEHYGVSEMTVYRVVDKYMKENFGGKNFDEVFEKVKAKVWS